MIYGKHGSQKKIFFLPSAERTLLQESPSTAETLYWLYTTFCLVVSTLNSAEENEHGMEIR